MNTTDAPLGYGTYLGTAAAVLGAAGTIVAAINDNDVATAGAAAATIVAIFETLHGRFAQAVARIRKGAEKAAPWIDEAQERLATGSEKTSTLPKE